MIHKNWTELIRPKRLEVDSETHTPTYGKFACEPLERGFGTTLGNALRRVLLSSLGGRPSPGSTSMTCITNFRRSREFWRTSPRSS